MTTLTGTKDVDLLILQKLNDRDLFNFCLVSKQANRLCRDENFWKTRFNKKYDSYYKPEGRTWRNQYLIVTKDLDPYSNNPWRFFNTFSWNMNNPDIEELIKESTEKFKNIFYLLNLGQKIKIAFPMDPFEIFPPILREYTSATHFTPLKVLKLVYDFYQENVTGKELEQQRGNPYADDFDITDVNEGKVQRVDLLGRPYFEGFDQLGEYHKVNIF